MVDLNWDVQVCEVNYVNNILFSGFNQQSYLILIIGLVWCLSRNHFCYVPGAGTYLSCLGVALAVPLDPSSGRGTFHFSDLSLNLNIKFGFT